MRSVLLYIFLFAFTFTLFSQEIPFSVIEKKGKVDVKFRDSNWDTVNTGDVVLSGTEIFTGLHSSITLEFGEGSYITVNQLSRMTIDNIRLKKNEVNIDLNLQNGFLVLYSKKNLNLNSKISVNFSQGNAVFENSGGEVYLRKEQGAIIKSFLGKVTINPKIKTLYFITKDEVCGINPDGMLIEYDYFLRQDIIIKPNEITNKNQIDAYFEYLSKPFNFETGSNDYRDNLRP